jgi:hypothetical protein
MSEQTAETWWEIAPGRTQGATPLCQQCIRVLGWDEFYTSRVIIAYRDFLEAKRFTRDYDSKQLLAPLPVARMWQQHVLDMKDYEDDCNLLVGGLVCYIRDEETTMGQEEREARINTTKTLMRIRYGADAEDLDDGIWNFDDSAHGIEKFNKAESQSRRKRSRSCSRVKEARAVRANPRADQNPQEVLSDPDSITIKVKDQFGENFQLKLKKSEQIKKMIYYISNEIGLPERYLRFYINNLRVLETETPNTLRMKEENQIILWYDGGLNFVDSTPRQSNETVIWVSISSDPTSKVPMYTRMKTTTKMKELSDYLLEQNVRISKKVQNVIPGSQCYSGVDLYFRQNHIQAGDTAASLGWTREDRIIYKPRYMYSQVEESSADENSQEELSDPEPTTI